MRDALKSGSLAALATEWPRVSELLDRALALPDTDRAAWLDTLSGPDALHRPMLERLLAANARARASDFLGTLPTLPPREPVEPGTGLAAGTAIGPYRLIEAIGRGGMAAVWLAERDDGMGRRRVALKLPHVVWSEAFGERLAREREILATLEHEHVARLYDGGVDAQGRPWIALEYVEGEPIDVWAARTGASVRARVDLLLQVMSALSHAHARLVVHRDLKPANILVTPDGRAKLLDFGIAKLLEDGRTRATALTELAGRALTVDYASPEQIRGEALGTASDVYSLAVVAYELLTGTPPYRLHRGSAAELEEAIASAEPRAASSAVSDRATARQLRGDLDAILHHALRKQPGDRYPTMEAFADDLRRWRDGAPVRARPDRFAYRAAKFVLRHRAAVAIGTLALCAVVGGASVALWQAREARLEATRARAVGAFIESVFNANAGEQSDPERARSTTARELLDRGADRLKTELSDSPRARLEMIQLIGQMYEDMAVFDRFLDLQSMRVEQAGALDGPDGPLTVEAIAGQAHALTLNGRFDEAERLLADADARLARRGDTDSHARFRVDVMRASLARRTAAADGLPIAEHALALAHRHPPDADTLLALQVYGDLARANEQVEHARDAFQEWVTIAETHPPLGVTELGLAYGQLGRTQAELGQLQQAEASFRKGFELQSKRNDDPSYLHIVETQFGEFLTDQSRYRDALAQLAPAVRWVDETQPKEANLSRFIRGMSYDAALEYGHPEDWIEGLRRDPGLADPAGPPVFDRVRSTAREAEAWLEFGRLDEAERSIARGRLMIERSQGRVSSEVIETPARALLVARGKGCEALASFEAARKANGLPPQPDATSSTRILALTGGFEMACGHATVAIERARLALDKIRDAGSPLAERPSQARAERVLGEALAASGDRVQGLAALDRSVDLHRALYDNDRSPRLAAVLRLRAETLIALGRKADADADRREADRIVATFKT